jgi:hypothetical protein
MGVLIDPVRATSDSHTSYDAFVEETLYWRTRDATSSTCGVWGSEA